MKFFKTMMICIAVLALTAGVAVAEELTIKGSTTVQPIAQKLVEAFEKMESGVSISLSGGGSGNGAKALLDGTTDIANMSRPMKDKEKKAAMEKGIGVVENIVAYDALAPVVHPSNPVSDLTKEQLKDIYTGKIKNWKEVGGEDKKIVAISRETSSGTYETWETKIMGKDRPRGVQSLASNGAVATAVEKNKFAIGYIGLGYVKNAKVKAVKVEGVMASSKAAKDGSYSIARALYMYTPEKIKPMAKKFIDFAKSEEGQKLVTEVGFIDIF